MNNVLLGIDVGSTTVKVVVVDPISRNILWSKYQRHETKQPQLVREMLCEIQNNFPQYSIEQMRAYITGSGAGPIAPVIGAKFVQEVNAVTMAVEELHPDVGSVVELGGQDAKIIIFKENKNTGGKQVITSMNDKCASGTGATIDKCMIKVGMSPDDISTLSFDASKLHHVAAKCGVFAETDIVNLVKSGVPKEEIMCSLADAIVQQNLSVLARGNTLRSKVLLLGGPNTYLPFLQSCWRHRIPQTWEERGYLYAKDKPLSEIIMVPENAEYYAAYGAVLFGMFDKSQSDELFKGLAPLHTFIESGRKEKLGNQAGPALVESSEDQDDFSQQYRVPVFTPATLKPQQNISGFIGLDGGSTSSKVVLVSAEGEVLKKVYRLSQGNPIADMKEMFAELHNWAHDQHASLTILGFGVTGYAGDVMDAALQADSNVVETIAHMKSATHYFPNADVICDIGGQDIKVLFLQNGEIKNFRLSNSCSAGNGMLLQAMADQFGVPVTEYADTAFKAQLSPKFSYGCAVFLDSDRVNFQKEGYTAEELLAGLALVLPKNIWQYVVQIPRMAELGKVYVLQGGTQYNLAAVKAQADYIKERVPDAEIHIHPHCGEAGALGAAYEAMRVVEKQGSSRFIGLQEAINLEYKTTTDETTRCDFCANNCSRTFIDTQTKTGDIARYISGFSCEKGTVEDYDALRELNKERRLRLKRFPNLVEYEGRLNFSGFYKTESLPDENAVIDDIKVSKNFLGRVKHTPFTRTFNRSDAETLDFRKTIKIGIPRVLNIWSTGPFWRAYLESLGIPGRNIIFSDETSEEMWAAGGKYGSVDPCFPAKVVQAHIHNLLFTQHQRKPIDLIFFPALTHVPTFVTGTRDTTCCPIVAGTPGVTRAAFTKENDFFTERDITYLNPTLTLNEPLLLKKKLFETFSEHLKITEDESNFAVEQGFKALKELDTRLEEKGKAILDHVEKENKLAILLLGRPYHNDPGLNHLVLEEFQALGYPVLSIRSIPKDPEYLLRFFGNDIKSGRIQSPLDVHDVWPENYSANSVQKVWAAKFAARHPNVAVLDLSSFKCGHDAPTYSIIDNIISASKTPFAALHDIDANKPTGSIKIRVKTYAHTLMMAEEALLQNERNAEANNIEKLSRMLDTDRQESTSNGITGITNDNTIDVVMID